jgi:basic membrane protein A
MKKRTWFILLMVVLVLTGTLSVVKAQNAPFRVAVVAPSATNDLAFSQSMSDAMKAVQKSMGEDKFQFDFQDNTFVVDDAAAALRDWASSGKYNLIIAHGSQFGSVIQELAPDFPNIAFAWGTDVNTFGLKNVFAYTVAAEQGGYINGAVAATMTKSGVIGVVGPIEVGDAKQYVDGFKAGVAATKPDVKVDVNYIQSFSDVTLATEAAKTMVSDGADILTGTAQMVVGPIAVAKENKLLWFGTQASQAELADQSGVLFQVYRWDVVLPDMIKAIQGGTLGGQAFTLTLQNGGLDMQISDKRTISDDDKKALQATVDDLKQRIVSGEITILPAAEATPEATPESTPSS